MEDSLRTLRRSPGRLPWLRRRPTTSGVLAATAGGVGGYALLALLPWTRPAAPLLSLVLALGFTVLLAGVVARRREPWLMLTAGGVVVMLGMRIVAGAVSRPAFSPSVPLATYATHPVLMLTGLAGYVLVYLGLNALVRRSLRELARGPALDGLLSSAVVVAAAVTVTQWVLRDGEMPDLALVALVGRASLSLLVLSLTLVAVSMRGRHRDARIDLVALAAGGLHVSDVLALLGTCGLLDDRSPVTVALVGALRLVVVGLFTAAAASPAPAAVNGVIPRRTMVVLSASVMSAATALLALDHLYRLPHAAFALTIAVVAVAGTRIFLLSAEVSRLLDARHLALTDDLTGLPNRRALTEDLAATLAGDADGADGADGDHPAGACLLLVDLDAFKEVNDRHGHTTGDQVLRAVAERLRPLGAGKRVLARTGGDEFALLVPGDDVARAVALAERAVALLATPVAVEGRQVRLGASTGVAHADAGTTPSELLRRADLAMYLAKGAGGGVRLFDADVDAAARHRARLLDDLRSALAGPATQPGQLVAHFQPQVDADGTVSGVEALARWEHPELGLLQPAAFIDLAEEHGLLPAVTERVLRQTVAQAGAWRAARLDLRVAVNLSASCLDWPHLLDVVDDVLATRVLPADRLVLEVTETGLVSEAAHGLEVVAQLVARGVELSVDDYGTGYSSLAHLDHLPASELKLDRAFTVRLLDDARTGLIVRATVGLAHDLGMRLVAEGVEDAATREALTALGCDVTQGYWHSGPLAAEELTPWLLERSRAARPAHA